MLLLGCSGGLSVVRGHIAHRQAREVEGPGEIGPSAARDGEAEPMAVVVREGRERRLASDFRKRRLPVVGAFPEEVVVRRRAEERAEHGGERAARARTRDVKRHLRRKVAADHVRAVPHREEVNDGTLVAVRHRHGIRHERIRARAGHARAGDAVRGPAAGVVPTARRAARPVVHRTELLLRRRTLHLREKSEPHEGDLPSLRRLPASEPRASIRPSAAHILAVAPLNEIAHEPDAPHVLRLHSSVHPRAHLRLRALRGKHFPPTVTPSVVSGYAVDHRRNKSAHGGNRPRPSRVKFLLKHREVYALDVSGGRLRRREARLPAEGHRTNTGIDDVGCGVVVAGKCPHTAGSALRAQRLAGHVRPELRRERRRSERRFGHDRRA